MIGHVGGAEQCKLMVGYSILRAVESGQEG